MNLKERLRKKLKKNGGFTLIEMLIVVAIIAILVVVSIPMVSSNLNEAKKATDDANVRAAKAAASIEYLVTDKATGTQTYFYNAATGDVQKNNSTGISGYNQLEQNKLTSNTACVKVVVGTDGTIASDGVTWEAANTPAGS